MMTSLLLTVLLTAPVPTPDTTEHPGAVAAPASSPATYPDADGFAERRQVILEGLAEGGLDKWRRGYFAGGDPGKYLPGHAMAKLLLDRDREEVAKYMNDDRSFKEHYHFAAVNWARFYPLFGDEVLTKETKQKVADAAAKYSSYIPPHGGTENHKTMWWTSAVVLPEYFEGDRFAKQTDDKALATAKKQLKDYVKGLYAVGMGEWDSSTYLMFDVNGMLNIYDFSDDPETRLLAKAALDWYVTSYALKYTDGVFCAPHQRGYAGGPHESIADATGYLWWGSDAEVTADDTKDFRYTLHAITSGYRPNEVLCNLARKKLPELPAEFRNTKPNYWHGQNIEPKPAATHETVYLGKGFTMGTLWDGHASQHHRFQVVIDTDRGGVTMTAGHPRKSDHNGKKTGLGFTDGNSRYAQFAQVGPTALLMANIPEGEEADYLFVTIPDKAEVRKFEEGYVLDPGDGAGGAIVVVRPVGGAAEVVEAPPTKKQHATRLIKITGRRVGCAIEVLDAGGDPVDRARLIENTALDLGRLRDGSFTYTNQQGRTIGFTFNPDPDGDRHGDRMAKVTVDGKPVEWPDAVYDGPYVHQAGGVLAVNDGENGFVIDFSGDTPIYKPWSK